MKFRYLRVINSNMGGGAGGVEKVVLNMKPRRRCLIATISRKNRGQYRCQRKYRNNPTCPPPSGNSTVSSSVTSNASLPTSLPALHDTTFVFKLLRKESFWQAKTMLIFRRIGKLLVVICERRNEEMRGTDNK